MTNPIEQDAQHSHLSDDYIRNLEPENQRYDITLAQDFVISVLPNGIKTWAFIYDFQGRNRRKTLGVFPEMNFEDARVALEKARASMLRMDEPTVAPNEFGKMPAVLGGGKYIPKKERKPFNRRRLFKFLGALLAIAAIALIAVLVPRNWDQFGSQSETPKPETAPAESSLPFTLKKGEASDPGETDAADADSSPSEKPKTARGTTAGAANSVPPSNATGSSAGTTPTRGAPVSTSGTSASTSNNAGSVSDSGSTTPPASLGSKPVTTLASTTKATAFGGRVSRSRLTSRVQDLEPIDTLGPEISYQNSGFTRVFYFTELREFSDGAVVHRWSLNGEVHEEVVLNVSKSWRWRTYSNKDLTPGLNGEWKVETIDATGKVLDTELFTYNYQ